MQACDIIMGLMALYLITGAVQAFLFLYSNIVLNMDGPYSWIKEFLTVKTNGDVILFIPKLTVTLLGVGVLSILSAVLFPLAVLTGDVSEVKDAWEHIAENVAIIKLMVNWWNKPLKTDEIKEQMRKNKIQKLKDKLAKLENK